ncbi:50S ribosomal protein L4 [Candidatus Roizmanbacteria bacterium]|nr:50S ribosomal protein L4 [Candidatus Roizmanbacteria bacterium]
MPKTRKITKKEVAKKTRPKSGLTIPVYNLAGKELGNMELPKDIFSAKVNQKLLAQYIRVYFANQRQGTASTKTRGEVVGSTRKIYRQKGTGRARHGDIKAPIFVGGGVVGGPRPKDFSLKMNKKQTKKALFASLTLKIKENNILGINSQFLKMDPKTKLLVKFLKTLNLAKKSVLFVLAKVEKSNFTLAARNLSNVTILDSKSVNPFQVLKSQKIFITQDGLQVLSGHFLKNENK